MAKQTFTTGQVLTAAQMTSLQQTAMGGGSTTAKTTSYVLVAADAGTTVAMNAAGSTTITVNTSLFSAGDSVFIQNWGAGTCTVTAGTATVTTHGSLALAQWEGGTLYFTSSSAAIFFDISQSTGMTNPLTTTGDTIYSSSGSTPARLGIGSTGQVLTVASGIPSWATASSGGMTLINSGGTTLTGASVSISSIPATYKELYVYIENALPATNDTQIRMRFNSDTNTVYSSIRSVDTSITKNDTSSLGLAFNISNTAATTGIAIARIPNYFNTVAPKNFTCFSQATYSSNTAQWLVSQVTGVYNSTSAISSITLFPASGNWTSGTAYVYGVQ